MSFTIDPVLVGGDLMYGLYTGDGWLIKEFYNYGAADRAARHLDAIGRIPDDPPLPNPLPGDENPPE